jgi:hypothetical protein
LKREPGKRRGGFPDPNPHTIGRAATLVDMMKKHLSTTTDEVVERLIKNWDADVRANDAVYDHILHMADVLSDGIVKHPVRGHEAAPR